MVRPALSGEAGITMVLSLSVQLMQSYAHGGGRSQFLDNKGQDTDHIM